MSLFASLLKPIRSSTFTSLPMTTTTNTTTSSIITSFSSLKSITQFFIQRNYKIKSAIKRRCEDCFIVVRKKRHYVICKKNPRHKQRQG